MNRIAFGWASSSLMHLLQPLLEIAAIARAGEQRAHVEREHGRAASTSGTSLSTMRLASPSAIAVLPTPASPTNSGLFFCRRHSTWIVRLISAFAADHRIDLAVARLLVEVDAIGLERLALLLGLLVALGLGLLVDAAHRARFRHARPLGDAVADVVDRVVARHVLLLQEIGGVALALGEDRDQHVGAGHFLAAGRLHVDHRALDHALEAGGRLGVLGAVGHQVFEFGFEIVDEAGAQLVEIDVAGAHHGRGVLIVDQRQQQMLERRVLMMTLVGDRQRPMQGLFKAVRESWHFNFSSFVLAVPPESLLFHHALQRMLMFAGKVHDLRHFGLGHLVGEDAAFADPVLMHMQHDPMRRLVVLVEEALQHVDHEFHRRVVVVEKQHAIQVGRLVCGLRLGDDRGARPALIALCACGRRPPCGWAIWC